MKTTVATNRNAGRLGGPKRSPSRATDRTESLKTRASRRAKPIAALRTASPRTQLQPRHRTNQAPPPPSSSSDQLKILSREFFQIDALDLAPRLLGKFLRRDDVVLQITEVDALHFGCPRFFSGYIALESSFALEM